VYDSVIIVIILIIHYCSVISNEGIYNDKKLCVWRTEHVTDIIR